MWHEISKYAANILDDFIHWQRLLLHSFLMIHAILGIIIDEDYSKWYRLFLPWIRNNFRHVVHVIQKRINTWSFEKKNNIHINKSHDSFKDICVYNIKLYCLAHKFVRFYLVSAVTRTSQSEFNLGYRLIRVNLFYSVRINALGLY